MEKPHLWQFEFLLKPPCSSGFSVAWDCWYDSSWLDIPNYLIFLVWLPHVSYYDFILFHHIYSTNFRAQISNHMVLTCFNLPLPSKIQQTSTRIRLFTQIYPIFLRKSMAFPMVSPWFSHPFHGHGTGAQDVIAFNAAIVSCGRGLRWRDAVELTRQLRCSALAPSVVTYSSVPQKSYGRCREGWVI